MHTRGNSWSSMSYNLNWGGEVAAITSVVKLVQSVSQISVETKTID